MIARILCFFGFHSWIEWYEAKHSVQMRRCINCQRKQFLFEEQHWQVPGGEKPYKKWVNLEEYDI